MEVCDIHCLILYITKNDNSNVMDAGQEKGNRATIQMLFLGRIN